jgi:hypothetical protein
MESQPKIIGVSSAHPAERERIASLISNLAPYKLLDFDKPILDLVKTLTGSHFLKNSDAMTSYLGAEWSYIITEKFIENGQVTFKSVRYYLTPKQIFTRLKYEMRTIHSDIWVNAFFNNVNWESSVLSVQYPNQADAIIARGGVVIRFNDPANTSPVSREDALMDGYSFSHVIDQSAVGWANELNKILKIH